MTAVEYLAERYNYITWMRNRDEISAETADKWREKFLKEAKEMEAKQIAQAMVLRPDLLTIKFNTMDEYIKWIENKIEVCLDDKDLQREHWAFCQALKKYRELALLQSPVVRTLPNGKKVLAALKELSDCFTDEELKTMF